MNKQTSLTDKIIRIAKLLSKNQTTAKLYHLNEKEERVFASALKRSVKVEDILE